MTRDLSFVSLLVLAASGSLACASSGDAADSGSGGSPGGGSGIGASGGMVNGSGGSGTGDTSGGGAADAPGGGGSGGNAAGGDSSGNGGSPDGGSGGSTNGSGGASTGGSGAANGGSSGDTTGVPVEETAPALPAPRQEHAVTALGGDVYVLGGFNPDNTASMDVFDPDAGTWRSAASFPVGCHHPNLAAVGGLLYVAGFHLGGDSPLRVGDPRTFAYDPVSDTWSARAEMPEGTGRGASCVAVHGSQIYLFGGSDDPTLAISSVYDTKEDSWTSLPDLPRPRDHCFAATIAEKIYITAGRNGGITDIEPESWVFDPSEKTYQEIAQIPTPRGGVAGGVIDGKIYVFGGEGNASDPAGIFSDVEVYDPVSNSWQVLPPMSDPRHGFGGASIDGRIYLPGGGTSQGLAVVETHSVFFLEPGAGGTP